MSNTAGSPWEVSSPTRWPVGSVHPQRTCRSAAVCGSVIMTATRTLLYSCLAAVCLGLLAIQCYNLVALYRSEPTSLFSRMVPAESMSMPDLTICPNNRLRKDVLADWGMLTENGDINWSSFPDNATMDQLWMAAAVDLNRLVTCMEGACDSSGARGGPGRSLGHWTPFLNQGGVCYTLRLNLPMDLESHYLEFSFDALHNLPYEATKVYVYFHGEKAPVVKPHWWVQPGLIIPHPYVTLRPSEIVHVEASAELETVNSLRRRPCDSERRYSLAFCRQQCFWRLHAEDAGCRPPWIPGPAERSCRTLDDLFRSVIRPKLSASNVSHHCQCNIGCTSEQWTVKELHRADLDYRFRFSRLRLRWAERVHVTTEQLTYGVSSLLSDIGGIIGILFGASIVGLVQTSEGWLKAALAGRRWCRRRRQTAVQAEEGERKRKIKKPLDAWNGPDVKKLEDGAGELATEDGLWNTGAKYGPELGGMHQEMMDIEQM